MCNLIQVIRYQSTHRELWNNFLDASNTGTFLLHRDYMDYHKDRFKDHSLLFLDEKDNVLALLPANENQKSLISHQGLTYGGLILSSKTKLHHLGNYLAVLMDYLRQQQFQRFVYKPLPPIYTQHITQEDIYLLHCLGARVESRLLLSVINLQAPFIYQDQRIRHIKKAHKNDLIVSQSDDLATYWTIVCDNLAMRHKSRPIHTYEEIFKLQQSFPDNIKLYTCTRDSEMLAGILIYETEHVARSQYIASTAEGRSLGAMDLLIDRLLKQIYAHKLFFDFGSSHDEGLYRLNKGLLEQKEGFGARACIHDTYELIISPSDTL